MKVTALNRFWQRVTVPNDRAPVLETGLERGEDSEPDLEWDSEPDLEWDSGTAWGLESGEDSEPDLAWDSGTVWGSARAVGRVHARPVESR